MPVAPFVDHGMSQRFRLRTIAACDLAGHFNVPGVNGHDPLISFDPGADGISKAPVFPGPAAPAVAVALAVRSDLSSPPSRTMPRRRTQRLKRCRAMLQE